MQDEFEIFRAEAYGCASTTTPDFNDVAEEKEESAGKGAHAESVLFLDFDRRSQHRDNNVGIHRFRSSNQRCSQIVINKKDNRLFKGRRSEVGADVMVEIQSPSPTEIPASNLPSRRRYEEEKRMSGGSVKIIGLCRRKTAPADRRLSEKRNVIKESRMKTSRTMAPTESGITIDATLEVLMTSKHSIRKKSTNQPNAIFSSSSRPRDLAVSSNQITRRKSTTCTPERLRPTTQRSPGKHRRNSYAGALQSSPRSLSPPSRISGRRNSAITYLSDRVSCNSPPSPGSDAATAARHKSYDELRAATGRRSSSTASRLDHIEQRAMTGEPVDCHSSVDYSLEHLNNMHPESISAGSLELMNVGLSYNSSAIYRILVIGAPGVGKTTLTHQLLTNEYLANKEEPYQESVSHEHSVGIKLDGEESIVRLIDNFDSEEAIEKTTDVDAYLFVYSVTSRSSFSFVEVCLNRLRRLKTRRQAVAILVANKQDQVRSRVISPAEGKRLGSRRSCKVFEVSALLDHRVDEVLAAIIRETRLERKRTESSDATDSDEVVHQKPCLLLAFSLCGKLFHS